MSATLLLDADILAFQIAAVSQQTFQFDGCEPSTMVDEWEEVIPRIDFAVTKLKEQLDTDKVIVCLSCPTAENWRLKVLPTYKWNRDYAKRPVHLAAVKGYLADNYPSYRRDHLEADDIMGILATHPTLVPGEKIIVSEDKDMKTIPGWLFNPAKDEFPRSISEEEADRWHLYQTICGDTTDGYTGCPGAGPVAAEEVLAGTRWFSTKHILTRGPRKGLEVTQWGTEDCSDPWACVLSLYEKAGLTEADALVQARVARICRASDFDFQKKEVLLWTPDSVRHPEGATA